MCLSWIQACTAIHLLWSVLYISVGAVQIVAGIFFLFTIPVLRIGSNIWTGSWVNNNNTIVIIKCEKCMKQMTRVYFVIDDDIKKIHGSLSAVIDILVTVVMVVLNLNSMTCHCIREKRF